MFFIISLFIIANLYQNAITWGPLNHQTFACFLHNVNLTQECFNSENVQIYSSSLGNSSPDFLKFLEPKLHQFHFATILYQYSKIHNVNSGALNSFDPVHFSLGYGGHLAQDLVGHYRNSYLSPQYNRYLQFSTDSHQVQNTLPNLDRFIFKKHKDEVKSFLYNANLFYALKYPSSYKPHNQTAMNNAIESLSSTIDIELSLAKLNTEYGSQMKDMDFCKAVEVKEAIKNFKRAFNWSLDAWKYFIYLMELNSHENIVEAKMQEYVHLLFSRNNGTLCLL